MDVATVIIDQTEVAITIEEPAIEVALAVFNTTTNTATLTHPDNPSTLITWDADGGVTIASNVRVTVKNTTTGDETQWA